MFGGMALGSVMALEERVKDLSKRIDKLERRIEKLERRNEDGKSN